MWLIRYHLRHFFNNVLDSLNLGDHNVPFGARKEGYFFSESIHTIEFRHHEFEFKILRDINAIGIPLFLITIKAFGIIVYENQWIHQVPAEMKKGIRAIIREIAKYNRHFPRRKVNKQLRLRQRLDKEEQKAKEMAKFTAELAKFTAEQHRLTQKYKEEHL